MDDFNMQYKVILMVRKHRVAVSSFRTVTRKNCSTKRNGTYYEKKKCIRRITGSDLGEKTANNTLKGSTNRIAFRTPFLLIQQRLSIFNTQIGIVNSKLFNKRT